MNKGSCDKLGDVLGQHGFELPDDQIDQLDEYCKLLWDWNERLNLTRHTDYERFVSRDVADTVQLGKLLHKKEEVLDVGTGGGVPGIVLAIIRPDLQISLCESVGKKAKAVDSIVENLALPVAVYDQRAENVLQDFRYDAIVARAVGPLWKMLKWFEPHWASIGRVLAIKGPRWVDERGEARHRGYFRKLELRRAASYPMAGTDSESVILKIWPQGRPEPK